MKTKKQKSISALKKEKWRLLSSYVRKSQANSEGLVQCYTCEQVNHYKNMDLGHYWGRQYGATYFDLDNLRIQCVHCNRFMEGNKAKFGMKLTRELGQEKMERLEIKANMKYHFDRFALEEDIKMLKLKLKKL